MCHLAGTIGTLRFSGPAASVWNGYDVADDGTYCRRRLALRPETQRELGIGNFVARLHHPRIPDPRHHNGILSALYLAKPLIPYEYRKRLHGNDAASFGIWVRHVINVVTDLPETLRFMLHFLRYRRLSERKFPSIVIRSKANYFSLDFHAEQVPDPASRVYLIDETDQLGMKRIGIDWRYGAKDVETVSRSLALLAEDIASSGVGRFDYDPASVEYEMTRYGAYGGHHIGTARMGCDPATSVVDTDCRVHEISNLYVAGSAVFPTSSQANPTLTAVALALRLATHLKEGDS
jgi:choline dehydrogenase-like flavoprotein